jgi:hypothetical protein
MSEEKVEKETLSPEQVEANRKKLMEYYKKQTEVLKAQVQYEQLAAEIEMHRAKRMEMIIRQAQMAAGPPDQESEDPEAPEGKKKERILKKAD